MAEQSKLPPFDARTFFGQGLLMGGGDELEGWVKSKLTGRPYEEERQRAIDKVRSFAQQYPVGAALQEFGGAALPSVAAAFVPPLEAITAPRTVGALNTLRKAVSFNPATPVLSGAKVGLGTGAVGGALAAEPDSRGTGAIYGGLGGTLFGGALPMVATAGRNIYDFGKRNLFGTSERSLSNTAAAKMAEEMRNTGLTSEDLKQFTKEDYDVLGIPSMIANYLPSSAEAVVARAGTAESGKLAGKLQSQQRGQTKRVEERIKDQLKPKDYFSTSDELTTQLRANAKNMYDEAYSFGDVNDPRILEVLNHPKFKAAFEDAKAISSTEAAAAKLRGEDISKYMIKEMYMPKEIKPGIFELELKEIPDVRTLDYIKRGIDSVIEKGYKGEGMSSAEATALKGLRKEFVNAIDENVPAYAAARAKYAGDLEVKDALTMGMKDFNKLKQEEITKFMASASDAEKQAFRTGAIRNLQDTIFDRPNAAGAILRSDKLGSKLKAMFDQPEEYELIKAALEKEALFYSRAGEALSGSRTTPKAEAIKRIEAAPQSSEGPGNIVSSTVRFLFQGEDKVSPEVLGKMADMLSKGTPSEVAAVVRAIEKQDAMRNAKRIASEAAVKGTISGTAGGTAMPIVDSSEVSAGDVMLNEIINRYNSLTQGTNSGQER
jgi:hypothetical protein